MYPDDGARVNRREQRAYLRVCLEWPQQHLFPPGPRATLHFMNGQAAQGAPRLLIIGLGNSLLTDDGVGVHAVRELRRDPIPGATIVEVGTAVLDALDALERADVVIALDAVQANGTPGTVYEVGPLPARPPGPLASLHELDLRDALRLLPERPPRVIVLGVEPACLDFGLELSSPVKAALPALLAATRRAAAGIMRTH